MTNRILVVLRGRPGLGHVTPGIAVGQELRRRGCEVKVLTYARGPAFLHRSMWDGWATIPVSEDYIDWPGLNLYDHGVRFVVPEAQRMQADLVILGGEYLLGVLGHVLHCPCAMMYNPEIMEDASRNDVSGRLFAGIFEKCRAMIPLCPPSWSTAADHFLKLKDRTLPPGPFRVSPQGRQERVDGMVTVITNGGGIDFPRQTNSYSSAEVRPSAWVRQTKELTRAAIAAALADSTASDRVLVFSCLDEAFNCTLLNEFRHATNLRVSSTSLEYYRWLRHAHVLVSRAGLGCIGDTEAVSAEVVMWYLDGHDEQRANAMALRDRRPNTNIVPDAQQLYTATRSAVHRARSRRLVPNCECEENTARTVDAILSILR